MKGYFFSNQMMVKESENIAKILSSRYDDRKNISRMSILEEMIEV